jgi:hypothetical protein
MIRPYLILVLYVLYYYSVGGSARSLRSNHVPHLDVDDFSMMTKIEFWSKTSKLPCLFFRVIESADENVYKSYKMGNIRLEKLGNDRFLPVGTRSRVYILLCWCCCCWGPLIKLASISADS